DSAPPGDRDADKPKKVDQANAGGNRPGANVPVQPANPGGNVPVQPANPPVQPAKPFNPPVPPAKPPDREVPGKPVNPPPIQPAEEPLPKTNARWKADVDAGEPVKLPKDLKLAIPVPKRGEVLF